MKGRKIFGEGTDYLQPYGVLWRTGANSGSVLTLSTDAKIAGTDVKAGSYLIFTVPGKDSWDFMLYSDIKLGGNTAIGGGGPLRGYNRRTIGCGRLCCRRGHCATVRQQFCCTFFQRTGR